MNSNLGSQISGTFFYQDLGHLVTNLWGVAFVLGSVAAFLFVVMGGVLWITAGGDKGKVEQAKERITQGIIGLAILAVSWAVALLVQRFLGLSILGGSGSGGAGGAGASGEGTACTTVVTGQGNCRNQDCQFYTCDGHTWHGTGQYESTCQGNPSAGCYGQHQGQF